MGSRPLTELHKQKGLGICKRLLDHCGKECDPFLEIIFTGDETWIHHYEPGSKHKSMEWKYPHSTVKKKFKAQPAAGKVMLTGFWDSQRLLLEHFQERCSTVNSVVCSEMLRDKLKPAIGNKRRGRLSKGAVLLHDNARPQTAAHTVETLKKQNMGYWSIRRVVLIDLSDPLEALSGRRYTTDQQLKETVHAWLVSQPKPFCSEGIKKIVQRWTKCSSKQGDYFEKLCTCKIFYVIHTVHF
jgi:hypothetical protein